MTPSDKLERFTAGEAFSVDPNAIERELSSLWQAAGQKTEGQAPVTRACLINVVALLEERETVEGHGAADTLQAWIDDLPRHVAARALVVRSRPHDPAQEDLQSWISANCIIAGGGGKLVCSEEVTIAARGGADHHVPGLVRALLVPGLPTCLLTSGVPYGALAEPLGRLADRFITDVDASGHSAPLATLGRVLRAGTPSAMDLGWVRTASVRAELAGAFDPPFDPSALLDVRRIEAFSPPEVQWSTRLILGWLAHALGASRPNQTDGRTLLTRGSGVPLEVALTVGPGEGPTFTLHLPALLEPVRVMCRGTHVEVVGPHLATVVRPRQEMDAASAVARALIHPRDDAAFRSALEVAEHL